jgi:hypothetical protein
MEGLAMKPVRVALLGATSHIAKGLIACWSKHDDRELFLYARSPERVREFLIHLEPSRGDVFPICEFGKRQYDVVVNCVGIGSPQKLKDNLEDIFQITSSFDDMVLGYLADHSQALYVNLSSGAAYGTDFSEPVNDQSRARFDINNLKSEEFYGIAKLHSEARHRALSWLNIVDLRIFGYFSRYIDLNDKFLLSEIISCMKNKRTLVTSSVEIWRDFLHPCDLISLIDLCVARCPLNTSFDAYSDKEVSKFEILNFFAETYGLEYRIDKSYQMLAATGQKNRYYSAGRKAREIGYVPAFTSIKCIEAETSAIVAAW